MTDWDSFAKLALISVLCCLMGIGVIGMFIASSLHSLDHNIKRIKWHLDDRADRERRERMKKE
jgi:hypothetical protein